MSTAFKNIGNITECENVLLHEFMEEVLELIEIFDKLEIPELEDKKHYKVTFKSSFGLLKVIINSIINNLSQNYGLSEDKSVDLFIVLSELLVNAIENNNKGSFDEEICIKYVIDFENRRIYFSIKTCSINPTYKNVNPSGLNLVKLFVDNLYQDDEANRILFRLKF